MTPLDSNQLKQLSRELINKDRWADVIRRFIDVLKVNIFLVDFSGEMIVPPLVEGGRGIFGSQFLTASFGFGLAGKQKDFLKNFRPNGLYLECNDQLGLQVFAIPVRANKDQVIGYLMVGPFVLNKRLDNAAYEELASRFNIKVSNLLDSLYEIRVVSHLTIKAILDLLAQIAKDIIDLNLEKRRLDQVRANRETLSREVTEAAKDIYATIHLDELLITVLDLALNLTQAECGSLMLIDKETGELSIKVSRGIEKEKFRNVRVKLGEGISGLAAKENKAFIISGVQGDNRIKPFLQRPEIKQSAILPLSSRNRVVGVLNLHTKSEESKVEFNENSLQNLSRLISTAIQTF